jgi:hypothetical protein
MLRKSSIAFQKRRCLYEVTPPSGYLCQLYILKPPDLKTGVDPVEVGRGLPSSVP